MRILMIILSLVMASGIILAAGGQDPKDSKDLLREKPLLQQVGGSCPQPGRCRGYCQLSKHTDGNWYYTGDCKSDISGMQLQCITGFVCPTTLATNPGVGFYNTCNTYVDFRKGCVF